MYVWTAAVEANVTKDDILLENESNSLDLGLVDPQSTGHYLKTPEIIEDIIRSRYGSAAEELLSKFQERTFPCIVHFRDTNPRTDVIEIALHYLYNAVHELRPLGSKHTCFDGNGRTVAPNTVIQVEFLN